MKVRAWVAELPTSVLIYLPVFVAAIVACSNTLSMDFIWDDFALIEENSLIRSLGNIPLFFISNLSAGTPYFDNSVPYYRPFQTVSLALNYLFSGTDPFGYHLTNVLLHGAVSLLVCHLAARLTASPRAALCAGLIFAVHPVHAEAVAWIVARNELLAALFMFAAFSRYLVWREEGKALTLLFSLLLFLGSLFSMEMGITLPLLVFLYEWGAGTGIRTGLRRTLPFLLPAGIYLLVRSSVISGLPEDPYPFSWHLATAPVLVWKYLRLLLFPLDLNTFYDIGIKYSLTDPEVLMKGGAVALAAGAIFLLRRDRHLFFSLLWIAATLLPVSGLMTFINPSLIAERYLYIPSAGFAWACGIVFSRMHARLRAMGATVTGKGAPKGIAGSLPAVLLGSIVVVLLCVTYQRNYIWQDNLHFLTLKSAQGSPEYHLNRGILYRKEANYPEAIQEFRALLKMRPQVAMAHNELGVAYASTGRMPEAKGEFQAALALDPELADATTNLARLYTFEGDRCRAVELYENALRCSPGNTTLQENLTALLAVK